MAKTASKRTFAARLLCPRCDASSWLTLSNREESFEQILQLEWEFKCREHGPQRGKPFELLEVAPLDDPAPSPTDFPASHAATLVSTPPAAPKQKSRASKRAAIHVPVVIYGFGSVGGSFKEESETVLVNAGGALVLLKAKLSIGDTVFLLDKITGLQQEVRVAFVEPYADRESRVGLAFKEPTSDFWRRARKKPRVPKSMRVLVKGTDPEGRAFKQSAFTVDLSQDGARLDGVGMLTTTGQTIQVRRLWRNANYRVVWVGKPGTAEAGQVGLFSLQSGKNIWNVKLPDAQGPNAVPSRKK